ncbi:MAG: sigma factor-like helix-turn-helix DNA-binding protein, partial [Planctomycetaceae bacterium]|nr:sigma factor-like helix-turn-helix DNA-binding protein [Planctomycetaceae bacterium]
ERALDEELQRLPQADREAIVRCHLIGMTQEQAAAELAVSLSTLRRRLDRGIHTLRQRFARRGLWVPVIAVVWNSLASAGQGAEQSSMSPELIDSAVAGGKGTWLRGGGVSRSVRNLSERVQTMSQRQRWQRAGGWFILTALLISSGIWPWLPTTHAGPPPTVASPGVSKVSAKPKMKSSPKVVAKSQGPTSTVAPVANPANGISALPSGAANSSSSSSGSAFSGVMNINGREFRTADPAEFQRLLRIQQGMFPQLPFPGPSASAFQGAVNINGVEQKFSDPAAFQQAVQGLNLPIPLNLVK